MALEDPDAPLHCCHCKGFLPLLILPLLLLLLPACCTLVPRPRQAGSNCWPCMQQVFPEDIAPLLLGIMGKAVQKRAFSGEREGSRGQAGRF
eukprot:1141515-Pelagomonas_calceolata.AAC.12